MLSVVATDMLNSVKVEEPSATNTRLYVELKSQRKSEIDKKRRDMSNSGNVEEPSAKNRRL